MLEKPHLSERQAASNNKVGQLPTERKLESGTFVRFAKEDGTICRGCLLKKYNESDRCWLVSYYIEDVELKKDFCKFYTGVVCPAQIITHWTG